MPSLDEIKGYAQLGALGILLLIVVRLWLSTSRELKTSQEARIETERQHGKEMLQLERACNRQTSELMKQSDMTLGSLEMMLERISKQMDEFMER